MVNEVVLPRDEKGQSIADREEGPSWGCGASYVSEKYFFQ